jgi:hypothetical protein
LYVSLPALFTTDKACCAKEIERMGFNKSYTYHAIGKDCRAAHKKGEEKKYGFLACSPNCPSSIDSSIVLIGGKV